MAKTAETTSFNEVLLPQEKAFVIKALATATERTKQAKLEYGEAVGNSGGDWVFDDPASQAALQEHGLKEAAERFFRRLVHFEVVSNPSEENPTAVPGSRVGVSIGGYEDLYDIVTRKIPGLPQDPEVFALLSTHSAMGQAILGAEVGNEISWKTEDGRKFNGTITSIDQSAQGHFYEAQGLAYSEDTE